MVGGQGPGHFLRFKHMNRRIFLKFAGLTGLVEILRAKTAVAATWTKVNASSGSAGTWRKLGASQQGGAKACLLGTGAFGRRSAHVWANGAVFACGYNISGGLGDNSTTHKSTYVSCVGI